MDGAFTSAGMDGSSDWRFKTHLANLPIYYEYKADGIGATEAIKGTYLDNYKRDLGSVHHRLHLRSRSCWPARPATTLWLSSSDEQAVFYQNGTWAWNDVSSLGAENLTMLPDLHRRGRRREPGPVHRHGELLVRQRHRQAGRHRRDPGRSWSGS